MRVISGSAKGHRLKCIQGLNTRPTGDRVKESVFNIIKNYIPDAKVLDLFSGTGNLSIESLSRGAKSAVMVDNNPQCIKIINENLEHTRLNDKSKVLKQDVISAIKNINDKFDIIFMDPPYNKGHLIPVLNQICNSDILNDDGLIVIERDKKDLLEDIAFDIVREEQYGETVVSFLKKYNG